MSENERPAQQMENVAPTNSADPSVGDMLRGALWLLGIQPPR